MSRLRANQITNENANGAPNFPHGLTVTGVVTATTAPQTMTSIVVGSAVTANSQGIDVTGIVTATSYRGDGSQLTGISVGITTEAITPSGITTHLLLSTADDHKVLATGGAPVLPTASGAKSLISFTIHKVGAAGTELFTGASVNFS